MKKHDVYLELYLFNRIIFHINARSSHDFSVKYTCTHYVIYKRLETMRL